MIVINAHINQASDFDNFEIEILLKEFLDIGIIDFITVNEVPDLLHALEVNRFQQVLLFTNFSPNYFYSNNGIDVSKFPMKPMPSWREEQYSFSASLFNHICQKYSIVEVHFITSALKRVLNDIDFGNVTNGLYTKVQRKRDWFKSGMDYNVLLKKYILDRTYESVNSILIPNHKFLVRKPVAQFCQS